MIKRGILQFLAGICLVLLPVRGFAQTCSAYSPPENPLLKGSFISTAALPTPALTQYVAKDGVSHTLLSFPGRVLVTLAANTSLTYAQNLFQSHGGTIISQIPVPGFYEVQVSAGSESSFISAINSDSSLEEAMPSMALQAGGVGQSAYEWYDSSLGNFISAFNSHAGASILVLDTLDLQISGCNNMTHMGAVYKLASAGGISAYPIDVLGVNGKFSNIMYVVDSLYNAWYLATFKSKKTVINISLQYPYPSDGTDRRVCARGVAGFTDYCLNSVTGGKSCQRYLCGLNSNTDNYNEWLYGEYDFLARIYQALERSTLSQILAPERDSILVVVASGNSGLNLTPAMTKLRTSFPYAWSRIIVVGGESGDLAQLNTAYNTSIHADDMAYYKSEKVSVFGCDKLYGTSFAAPVISNAAASSLLANNSQSIETLRNSIIKNSHFHFAGYDTVPELPDLYVPPQVNFTSAYGTPTVVPTSTSVYITNGHGTTLNKGGSLNAKCDFDNFTGSGPKGLFQAICSSHIGDYAYQYNYQATITPDTSVVLGLSPGAYFAHLPILSNTLKNNGTPPTLDMRLDVIKLVVSPTPYNIYILKGKTTAFKRTFTVDAVNNADKKANFNWTAKKASGGNWLVFVSTAGTGRKDDVEFTINPTGLAIGQYTGTIVVTHDIYPADSQTFTINLNVGAAEMMKGSISVEDSPFYNTKLSCAGTVTSTDGNLYIVRSNIQAPYAKILTTVHTTPNTCPMGGYVVLNPQLITDVTVSGNTYTFSYEDTGSGSGHFSGTMGDYAGTMELTMTLPNSTGEMKTTVHLQLVDDPLNATPNTAGTAIPSAALETMKKLLAPVDGSSAASGGDK